MGLRWALDGSYIGSTFTLFTLNVPPVRADARMSHNWQAITNRLSSISNASGTTTYTYNGDNDRVSQSVNGTLTTYVLDTATPLTMVLSETTGSITTRYWHGLDTLAQSNGTTTQYFAYDRLGSVRQLVDASGALQLAQTFDPYGNGYSKAGSGQSTLGYSGEQVDANGFVYLRARYYNPAYGRFFQRDTFRGVPDYPQTLNPYMYSLGNPVLYSDPSGQFPPFPDPFITLINSLKDFLEFSEYLGDFLKWYAGFQIVANAGFLYEFVDILAWGVPGSCESLFALLTGGKTIPQAMNDNAAFELGRWWARVLSLFWIAGEAAAGITTATGGTLLAIPSFGLTGAGTVVGSLMVIHAVGIGIAVAGKERVDPLILQSGVVWAAAYNAAKDSVPSDGSSRGGQQGSGQLKATTLDDMKKNPPDQIPGGEGYRPPRNWNGNKVKNPNGSGSGWPAKNGDVWVPTDHKGTNHSPHWDVQHRDGTHTSVYPDP